MTTLDKARQDAIEHAAREYPRESCGLIVNVAGKARYLACRNLSADPDAVQLDPADYAAAEDTGQVVAFVHSHPDHTSAPSPHDQAVHAASRLEWWIIGSDGVHVMPAAGELALEGRRFLHGAVDCYTLIRDYYRQVRGVVIPDFVRTDGWWDRGENLYLANFGAAGFVEVDSPQDGDVVLMKVLSGQPNHGAIWLDGDVLLHHLPGRLSCREVYGGYFRERTTHYLRYQGAGA